MGAIPPITLRHATLWAVSALLTGQSVMLSAQRAAEEQAAREAAIAKAAEADGADTETTPPDEPAEPSVWVSVAGADSLPPRWWNGSIVEASAERAALERFVPTPLTPAIAIADSPARPAFETTFVIPSSGRWLVERSAHLRHIQTTGPPAA
ncbi:MAG: hypothetical protein KDA32_07735 [Phycisphaerales bacterium]|nr:hypothetical protein [Phycisphaerales bacterium]